MCLLSRECEFHVAFPHCQFFRGLSTEPYFERPSGRCAFSRKDHAFALTLSSWSSFGGVRSCRRGGMIRLKSRLPVLLCRAPSKELGIKLGSTGFRHELTFFEYLEKRAFLRGQFFDLCCTDRLFAFILSRRTRQFVRTCHCRCRSFRLVSMAS